MTDQSSKGSTSDTSHDRLADITVAKPTLGRESQKTVNVDVSFRRREPANDETRMLWNAIRFHTEEISFPKFADFVKNALVNGNGPESKTTAQKARMKRVNSFRSGSFEGFIPGVDAYSVLKLAAEVFLLLRCGVCPCSAETEDGAIQRESDIFGSGEGSTDPGDLLDSLTQFLGQDRRSYIRSILRNAFDVGTDKDSRLISSPFSPLAIGFGPCLLELIWSYWHEQGMLVQTMNAISLRFQNVRARGRDPLAELEVDPLHPLSSFLWGYVQDESHRTTVARRAYEYSHHYGLALYGKAIPQIRPADSRTKFLQAFHDLLRTIDQLYREAADNTVTPDPFPLLIALRDMHMILAEGAHNQFRDLPWTARAEMLVQQWLLARPEMREFLHGRLMVPYPEPWMGTVDAMKRLQGWTDTNIVHFHDLAVFGERILLSIRHVSWSEIADPQAAADWAFFWRPEIQGYIHAYRMATGVSLSDEVVEISRTGDSRYLQPSFHLHNRLLEQRQRRALPNGEEAVRHPLGALPRMALRQP